MQTDTRRHSFRSQGQCNDSMLSKLPPLKGILFFIIGFVCKLRLFVLKFVHCLWHWIPTPEGFCQIFLTPYPLQYWNLNSCFPNQISQHRKKKRKFVMKVYYTSLWLTPQLSPAEPAKASPDCKDSGLRPSYRHWYSSHMGGCYSGYYGNCRLKMQHKSLATCTGSLAAYHTASWYTWLNLAKMSTMTQLLCQFLALGFTLNPQSQSPHFMLIFPAVQLMQKSLTVTESLTAQKRNGYRLQLAIAKPTTLLWHCRSVLGQTNVASATHKQDTSLSTLIQQCKTWNLVLLKMKTKCQ